MSSGTESTLLLLELARIGHPFLVHDGLIAEANRVARLHNEILESFATGDPPLEILEEPAPVDAPQE